MIFLCALLLLSDCAGFGPSTVIRDRFDYTEAISDSWKHQMPLNMVKMRYADTPVFRDVSSVISQYQIAGQVNLGATINNNPWSSSQSLGATGQYVDRPSITCTPILGDKIARSLMSPIPPRHPSLLQGGDRRVGISAFFGRRCRIDRANDRKAESAAVLPFLVSPIYSVPGFDDWSDRIPPDRKPLDDFCNELWADHLLPPDGNGPPLVEDPEIGEQGPLKTQQLEVLNSCEF